MPLASVRVGEGLAGALVPVANSSHSILSQGHPREIQEHPKALGFAKTEALTMASGAGAHSPTPTPTPVSEQCSFILC